MNVRLKQFLAAENITQSQFADKIEVVRASVSHVLSGRNNPSYEFIRSIMSKYPALNIEWLMFGKGKMYKDMAIKPVESDQNDEGLLFTDNLLQDSNETTAPVGYHEEDTYPADAEIETVTSDQTPQIAFSQRIVKKIVILYDDGSYQEIQEMGI